MNRSDIEREVADAVAQALIYYDKSNGIQLINKATKSIMELIAEQNKNGAFIMSDKDKEKWDKGEEVKARKLNVDNSKPAQPDQACKCGCHREAENQIKEPNHCIMCKPETNSKEDKEVTIKCQCHCHSWSAPECFECKKGNHKFPPFTSTEPEIKTNPCQHHKNSMVGGYVLCKDCNCIIDRFRVDMIEDDKEFWNRKLAEAKQRYERLEEIGRRLGLGRG